LGGLLLQPGLPSFKTKLIGKSVIVKLSLFSRAFSGTITAVDETGFCFVSDAMIAALREVTGSAMANLDSPSVYLPFSTMEWLVSSESKAAAASV
jgi:small nuclear ribonucleoprotein (snRNP)-like protein